MNPKRKKSFYIIIALIIIGFLNTILFSGKRNLGLVPDFLNLPSDHPLVIGASILSIIISIVLIIILIASGDLRRKK